MNERTHATVSRERLESSPSEIYVRTALRPIYDFKRARFFFALVSTHRAWVAMLQATSLIKEVDARRLQEAFDELEREGPSSLGEFNPDLEYFYSHMEYVLTQRLGEDVVGNINIARTRPEPLARMVMRERLLHLIRQLIALRAMVVQLAEREAETVMPGWTHFQHAQAATVGHYFVAINDILERDTDRLFSAYRTVNRCTLGCGALAGTSYPIDREMVSRRLGFDELVENSLDCVAGADHLTETVAGVAGMMINLSRLCDDLYTWSTLEFHFVEVGDDYSGSSSMMPQKKNPYPFEYVRARAGHITGLMTSVHAILHNTNFQDIKEVEEEALFPVFEALEVAEHAVELLTGTLSTVRFRAERMRSLAGSGFATATELAAVINRSEDISYRTSHRVVGDVVRRAVGAGLTATDVTGDLVDEASLKVIGRPLKMNTATIQEALDPDRFVEAHSSRGGTAPTEVRRMIDVRKVTLANDEERVQAELERIQAPAGD